MHQKINNLGRAGMGWGWVEYKDVTGKKSLTLGAKKDKFSEIHHT